jgi:acyl transferase domain-containing protein
MQNEVIPPHRNFTTLNPLINLDSIPAQIPLKAQEWKRDPTGKKPRIAGVSSFGITGTDAHAIVQETPTLKGPRLTRRGSDTIRPCHILTLSGKNEEALEDNLKQFKQYLETTDDKLIDIAHTANVGRGNFSHRASIIGKDKKEVLEKMKCSVVKKVAPEEAPKICFLFTGQGSQYPGMAKALYDNNLIFKMHFDQCDRVLNQGESPTFNLIN